MSSFRVGEILADRYRLTGRIAGGGMGEVWRGVDLVLDRPVAVKLMRAEYAEHPETLARFRAEARHVAALSDPAIAQVYDYGDARPDQPPFLVMELVDGPPLTELLAAGPLDPPRTADVIAQVAAGLAAAHAAGLVHRDIKPGNLLVGADGIVKITDFGIAHAAGSAPLTRTGAVIGTPAYLAPERLAGAWAGPASDLYSLGIVAHECLTGAPPFTGTAVEIALAHRHRELPPLPPSVPRELAALVGELTAREPAERPGSASQVAARARHLYDAMTGTYPTPVARLGSSSPAGAGRAAGLGSWSAAASSAMAGWSEHTLDDLPVMAPGGGAEVGARPPLGRRRDALRAASARRVAVPAIAALAVIAAVAGWMASGGSAATPQQRHPTTGTPAITAEAGRHVEVDSAALVGQPVGPVVRRLHQLGLRVRLIWVRVHGGDQAPGTVLSLRPAGTVRVGTTIVVIGAAQHGGQQRGHGNGGGGNGGDGGGGGNGGGGNGD